MKQLNCFLISCLILWFKYADTGVLQQDHVAFINPNANAEGHPDFDWDDSPMDNVHLRRKRYLGLSKRYKINRRYQECVAPGDVPGHCKHAVFCSMNVLGSSKRTLDYLCVIERAHVGVCCPDDIVLSALSGSRIVIDLPAGGHDYDDEEDKITGCGLTSTARYNPKPATMSNAKAKEWPWLAALFRTGGAGRQFCGGAVITENHILTAAHCVNGMKVNDLQVRLGEYDFRLVNETRARNVMIKEITVHQEYNEANYANDIAILTLSAPTTFDTYIWPICLPPVNGSYVNKTVTVAGWGQTQYAGAASEVLMEVQVPVWSQEKCIDAFAQRITDESLCAAAYEGGKDSCLGDSGGPLLYQLENGRWITIGIVSWGIGCGHKEQPGIYTRVDKYIPWIITNTITKQFITPYEEKKPTN